MSSFSRFFAIHIAGQIGLRHVRLSRRVTSLGIVSVLLVLSACQNVPPTPPALKLGTLLPLTGDLAAYGGSMQDAASLMVKTVNGCGGVVGQPIALVAADDQTEPAAGAAAMTKLAEVDRVAAVVGASASAVSAVAIDIAVRNQVVLMSPASTSPTFTERAKKGEFQGFWFRTTPPDTFQSKALAELAKAQGYQTVSVLTINDDYGNGLLNSFIPAFEALGGKVLNKAKPALYAPQSSTFESEVQAAFRGNPDAVLLISFPETGSLILKTAYQQGLLNQRTKVLATDGIKNPKIAALAGKNREGKYIAAGIIGTAPTAGGPAFAAFRDRYKAAYQREPGLFVANTWDAAALLALAAESAKTTIGAAIKDQIRTVANPPGQIVTDVCEALSLIRQGKDINYQGASSTLDLDAQGDVVGSYEIWIITDDAKIKNLGSITIGSSE
ncbi:MAG: ABC transporter substrate-binding protein [Scytolyngbya sp. HA4215-MV1]|nr:ABC transporter substrate-binding protein [Scytolyngbya sp. HA4215-MV1]